MNPRPIELAPDNFTLPARTPWGGFRLCEQYKAGLGLPTGLRVGESWELSVGPELPSNTVAGSELASVLASDPPAMLGDEARLGRTVTALLLKWLDTSDDLSLQIHPPNDAPSLAPDETGKVEAWYVVDHEPGAQIYLGLLPGTDEARVRQVLEHGGDLSQHMARHSVARGDLLIVDTGTPHAIGRGITLLEPQHVLPGKRGVTYRYWDWNRRYDAEGAPDPRGTPRALHVEQALAVTRFREATDPAWLGTRTRSFGWPQAESPARVEPLCGPAGASEAGLLCDSLAMARLVGDGRCALPDWRRLRSLTVIEGAIELGHGADALRVERGRSVAVPAACGALSARLERAHVLVCAAAS